MSDQLISAWTEQLESGLLAIPLELSDTQKELMIDYLVLLNRWNKAYNLTAIRDTGSMVALQLLDSLLIADHVTGDMILDIGTGAGLPGIPLAITFPEKQFTLLDSNGKKTRFISQFVNQSGLNNVKVVQARVEALDTEQQFSCITSRAFSSLANIIDWSKHLLAPNGCWLAMKGQYPEEELAAIPEQDYQVHSQSLFIPGHNDVSRYLISICVK